MKYKVCYPILILLFTLNSFNSSAQSIYEPEDISTVTSSIEEMGKMWTFDAVPVDYFQEKYGFHPSVQWLGDAMKSALQFGNGCSAAFVSSEGLIMTNHHCGRNYLPGLSPEGKDYLRDGYYAETLSEGLKIPGLFVDQLVKIENITDEVISVMNAGTDDKEKVQIKDAKINQIEKKYSEESGLICKVIELYHGGKYSLYFYKRYNDIRLVMAPDFQIASTGWDWDNFTYPRYELDFMFFRAYENGVPAKTENYLKFSENGAEEGEPVFVIGRPGSTQRLVSVAQLEFLRDKAYKYRLSLYNEVYKAYFELFEKHAERYSELLNMVMSWGNARKSYACRYMALRDDYIMAKKKDFENKLREKVESDPVLIQKYGHIWDSIKDSFDEYRKIVDESFAYSLPRFNQIRPVHYTIAESVIKYAEQMKLPEDQRQEEYQNDKISATVASIFPTGFDSELQNKLVRAHINYVAGILGKDNPLIKKLFNGKTGDEAADYVINKSLLTSQEKVELLLKKSPDEILNSDDPFISFIQNTRERLKEIQKRVEEINTTVAVLNQLLGQLVYKIYGDKIPPDATLTLRISDGTIKGYEYNGTIAPAKTTFYGLYDRWNSFGRKNYPWGLHPRWQKIPEGFDLATPVGFASTNDIVGGNSGSSVINKNMEVVGLVHDGNLESLAGDFIFLKNNNRTVATDSKGLLQALKFIYKTDRLIKELKSGKI